MLAFWLNNRGKVTGVAAGLAFGIGTAIFGFLQTVFIGLCIAAGYWIGKRIDENTDIKEFLGKIWKGR